MAPTEATTDKKAKRKLSERQQAMKITRAAFKKVKFTPDGRARRWEIFELTVGRYLRLRRGQRAWTPKLAKFVKNCMTHIADDVGETAGANGVSRKEIQLAAVKWMKKYKTYSGPCKNRMTHSFVATARQGEVCGAFLASNS